MTLAAVMGKSLCYLKKSLSQAVYEVSMFILVAAPWIDRKVLAALLERQRSGQGWNLSRPMWFFYASPKNTGARYLRETVLP